MTVGRRSTAFADAVDKVQKLAPSFRASRLITRGTRSFQPADWIEALLDCRDPAIALIETGDTPPDVRRAVGVACKLPLEPASLTSALQELRRVLGERGANKEVEAISAT